MKACPNCSGKNVAGGKFCAFCGTPLPSDLDQLLEAHGVSALSEILKGNDLLTVDALRSLTDDDLDELDLPTYGDRMRFKKMLDSLKTDESGKEKRTNSGTPRRSNQTGDFVGQLEALFEDMAGRITSTDLHWSPGIPANKLINARSSYAIPVEENVLALVDATVFGSAKNGMALCRGGIYLHNDWAAKTSGTFFVPWDKVSTESRVLKEEDKVKISEFHVGIGVFSNLSGSGVSGEVLDTIVLEAANLFRSCS